MTYPFLFAKNSKKLYNNSVGKKKERRDSSEGYLDLDPADTPVWSISHSCHRRIDCHRGNLPHGRWGDRRFHRFLYKRTDWRRRRVLTHRRFRHTHRKPFHPMSRGRLSSRPLAFIENKEKYL